MVAIILTSPLTWIMFMLVGLSATVQYAGLPAARTSKSVLAVCFGKWGAKTGAHMMLRMLGERTALMSPPARLLLLMYFVSSFLIMSHRLVEVEHKVAVYEHALFADAVLYLGIAVFMRVRWSTVLIMLAWIVLAFTAADALDHRESQKWFWVFQISAVMVLAWVCFYALDRLDYWGMWVGFTLALGETLSVIQVMGCQIMGDLIHAPEGLGSACERHYGMLVAWAPYAITTFILLWGLYRWYWPRPR